VKSLFQNRSWAWRVLFILALLHATCFAQPSAVPYRDDQILIKPKNGVNLSQLANFHSAVGGSVARTFSRIGNLQIIRLPKNENVTNLVAKYKRSGLVEFAEPDYFVHLAAIPNDPLFLSGAQWSLNNTGQVGSVDADIDAPEGWDVLSSASNVIVAVIDTGVRYTHEDLAANIWTNTVDGGHGYNVFTGSSDPYDDNGHGTLITGVIGAVGNNGLGIAGVAWRVQLMACKCVNAAGASSYSGLVAGVDYARSHGARVVNISLGAYYNSQSFSNALASLRDSGIICVAAAGNDGNNNDLDPFYPASFSSTLDNVVSVAASNPNDALSPYSNYGTTNVDLAAPGDDIYSTSSGSDSAYGSGTGTSIASPCVAGAVALVIARFPNESYRQIINRLLTATDPVPTLAGKCVSGGRLNLQKALGTPSVAVELQIISSQSGQIQFRLVGAPNQTYIVETSTNLFDWSPVLTNTTSSGGTVDFTDGAIADNPQKFFRARLQ
jgi:subtilisin family serine protease